MISTRKPASVVPLAGKLFKTLHRSITPTQEELP